MQIFAICPAGWYEDSVFHVNGFGFPPTEPSSATRFVFKYTLHLMKSRLLFIYILPEFVSFGSFFSLSSLDALQALWLCDALFAARAYYGNLNFFGGPSTTSVKASAKLKQLEEENEDAMFVIVSDVWLDNIEVMEKLNLMFSGQLLLHCGLRLCRLNNSQLGPEPFGRWHTLFCCVYTPSQ